MSEFVYGGGTVPNGKSDAKPVAGNPAQSVSAAEWNQVMQALVDLRAALTAIAPTGGAVVSSAIAGLATLLANTSGANSGDVTLAAVGSAPSANGATLSGQALTLQPADGTHPGALTSGAQTIGGAKTFTGSVKSTVNAPAGVASQTANFDATGNPATSSPALANFTKPLEIGGNYYTALDDAASCVYIGAMCAKTGGPVIEFLNNYGTPLGGAEISLLKSMYNGDLQIGGALYVGKLVPSMGRIIAEGASLYLIGAGTQINYNTTNAVENTSEWYKGSGATLVAALSDTGKLSIQNALALLDFVDDSATAGNRTVNHVTGVNKIAAGGTSCTITNSQVGANDHVDVTIATNDATAILKNVVVSAGAFTVNIAASTGDTKFSWKVTKRS